MIKIASKIFAIGFVLLLFSPLLMVNSDGETAGTQGGVLRYSSNHQLIPQSGDVGGGNLHWRLEGEAAREFRRALLDSVGNDTLYPDRANGDNTLDLEELMIYLKSSGMLESYVQRGGELNSFRTSQRAYSYRSFTPQRDISPDDYLRYYGIRITRSSLNTDSITDDTSGLVGTTGNDLSDIHIHFKISFHSGPGSAEYDINMVDSRVMDALWSSLIMPVERRFDNITSGQIDDLENGLALEHDDILVKDGMPQGVVANDTEILPDRHYNYDLNHNTVSLEPEHPISPGDNVTIVYAYGYEWEGPSEFMHWSWVVGTNSFYQPSYDDGTLYVIRTPAGEVLRYETTMDGADEPNARIKWDDFNFMENPQILFVLVVIFAYLTSMFPKKYYYDYRDTYPVKHQNRAEKSKGVHILATLMVIALLVFYFFPTIGNFFVRGVILIVLGVIATIVSFVLAKFIYSRKKSQIPDDILNPTVSSTVLSQPTRKKTVRKKKKKKKPSNSKKIYCDWCGEFFTIHKDRTLMTVVCPVCNRRQRMLKEGYNYLLLDAEGKHSYSILTDFIKEGLSAMVVTTKIPSKVEEKYGIRRAKIMWLSDHTSSEYTVLDPKRIEFEVTRALVNFAKTTERGVIFIDGLEYLIVENGFEKISKFIKKTTDICSINSTTYIIYVNPNSLSMSELSILKKEFDHTEDVRDPDFKKV